MSNPAPIPWYVPVIQLDDQGKPVQSYGLSKEFGNWLQTSIVASVANAPTVFPTVTLTAQGASIGTTPVPLPSLASGLYRVTYYARITTPATTGAATSSLIVTFGWTESTVTLSASGAAITGNLTTSMQTGTLMLLIDAATPISYATTYASNTAGEMKYRLSILVEAV